jgi:fumarate reductase subunit D
MDKVLFALLLSVVIVWLASRQKQGLLHNPDPSAVVAGFPRGIVDGFCVFGVVVFSLFSNKYTIYEIYNNGFLYGLGFAIGATTYTNFLFS